MPNGSASPSASEAEVEASEGPSELVSDGSEGKGGDVGWVVVVVVVVEVEEVVS